MKNLEKEKSLKFYLIVTITITDVKDVSEQVELHQCIFLKPSIKD